VKKLLFAVWLAAGLAPALTAHAQAFGQYTPAEILPVNTRVAGAYVDFSESALGALAQLRLSFYPNIDFGFQGGLTRLDLGPTTKTTVRLGADVRFGVAKASASRPLDIAAGGAIGVETGDDYSILTLGPSAVASRTFTFSQNSAIVPYAGVMLAFASVDVGDGNQTDFSVPLRLGAELRAMPGLRIAAELQLRLGDEFNDHVGFSAGVNLPF